MLPGPGMALRITSTQERWQAPAQNSESYLTFFL